MGGNCPTQVVTLQGISTDAISNTQMQKPRGNDLSEHKKVFPLKFDPDGTKQLHV